MKYLRELDNLKGTTVLMRVDFNVPVHNGKVLDDFRIRKILPTLTYLQSKKARIVLMSHMEPMANSGSKEKVSLEPVAGYLEKVGIRCSFIKNYRDARATIDSLEEGDIILLENLRMNEGEMKNDRAFARELASLGDIYVNEAFSVSHRAHSSVSAITEFIPSYGGLLFEQEVLHLSSAFNPDHPFLFILGGAKFETKLPLIEKFMGIADRVFVGGALANNFHKEMGQDIKKSLASPENFNLSRFFESPKLILPVDSVWKDDAIYDAGEKTMEMLQKEINEAKYILWNGPLGAYEMGYKEPTLDLARMIARATSHGAKSILGGGDTIATIAELKMEDKYTFVSTGGGAMLQFLAKGTLPGVEALENSTA